MVIEENITAKPLKGVFGKRAFGLVYEDAAGYRLEVPRQDLPRSPRVFSPEGDAMCMLSGSEIDETPVLAASIRSAEQKTDLPESGEVLSALHGDIPKLCAKAFDLEGKFTDHTQRARMQFDEHKKEMSITDAKGNRYVLPQFSPSITLPSQQSGTERKVRGAGENLSCEVPIGVGIDPNSTLGNSLSALANFAASSRDTSTLVAQRVQGEGIPLRAGPNDIPNLCKSGGGRGPAD